MHCMPLQHASPPAKHSGSQVYPSPYVPHGPPRQQTAHTGGRSLVTEALYAASSSPPPAAAGTAPAEFADDGAGSDLPPLKGTRAWSKVWILLCAAGSIAKERCVSANRNSRRAVLLPPLPLASHRSSQSPAPPGPRPCARLRARRPRSASHLHHIFLAEPLHRGDVFLPCPGIHSKVEKIRIVDARNPAGRVVGEGWG